LILFLYQAEDCIRCFHVTGVQTCALPISAFLSVVPSSRSASPPPIPRKPMPRRISRCVPLRPWPRAEHRVSTTKRTKGAKERDKGCAHDMVPDLPSDLILNADSAWV